LLKFNDHRHISTSDDLKLTSDKIVMNVVIINIIIIVIVIAFRICFYIIKNHNVITIRISTREITMQFGPRGDIKFVHASQCPGPIIVPHCSGLVPLQSPIFNLQSTNLWSGIWNLQLSVISISTRLRLVPCPEDQRLIYGINVFNSPFPNLLKFLQINKYMTKLKCIKL